MTFFEAAYIVASVGLPPLYRQVRQMLWRQIRLSPTQTATLLDVGGRKSNYTIGLPLRVYISDLPRRTPIQNALHLGIDQATAEHIRRRRSNVRGIVYDNMTCSGFHSGSFDYVLAIEVLEHVEYDREFIHEVYRVLRPGGLFIMTTPNGDFIPNRNPDHKRHYTRRQLSALLREKFDQFRVDYSIRDSVFRRWGLGSWTLRRPLQTGLSIFGNCINSIESRSPYVRNSPKRTCHLIACATRVWLGLG